MPRIAPAAPRANIRPITAPGRSGASAIATAVRIGVTAPASRLGSRKQTPTTATVAAIQPRPAASAAACTGSTSRTGVVVTAAVAASDQNNRRAITAGSPSASRPPIQ